VPPNRARRRSGAVVGIALAVVLAVVIYGVYSKYRQVTPYVPVPGCQAGTGPQAVSLDAGQAAVAATIAGVATRHKLPAEALTIAYSAALQESKLENLPYGDRDSVGIFQQRPSEGWGPAVDLEDPVYATTKFFDALVKVPGYTTMPVDQAAQAVQHSADGSAYEQWVDVSEQLTSYFTGASPHGVACWYTPSGRQDLAGAVGDLTETFGPKGRNGVLMGITVDRSAKKNSSSVAVVRVRRDAGWAVACWLVANAQEYGLHEVRYAGFEWKAADDSMSWQRASGPSALKDPRGSIVAG
jgi:hypothetical protein